MYKKIIISVILFIFLIIPTQVLAVDFNITDVEIDAYLQPDGNVSIQERHTYQFKGEFGGMIRELIPKEGTDIVHLEAFEGDRPLEVESNQYEHRIHRAGIDETITVDLFYEIKSGVDVYADVAEFYWPFFDRSNESTYENLIINIFPPEATTNVIAFGYDEAFEKEKVLQDGKVQFEFGEVPSKRNGDIRVAYDANLFGDATISSDKRMGDEIEAAKQELINEEVTSAEKKEALSSIGYIIVPLFGLLLLLLVFRSWLEANRRKKAIMKELGNQRGLPEQVLSLPATIYLTNYHQLLPETIAASLLDLVRKGHVKKLEDDRFLLINRQSLLRHEEELFNWLFEEIGNGTEFSFEDLTTYTKNKKNHENYQLHHSKWQKAVRNEVKEAGLYENKNKMRLIVGLFSLGFVPFSILFVMNGLIGLFFSSVILFLGMAIFAISYRPKKWEGAKMAYVWQRFKAQFPKMTDEDWQKLSEDDQMRAFIFGLGTNDKSLKKKNESLKSAFKNTASTNGHQLGTAYSFDPSWMVIAGVATSSFKSAQKEASIADSHSEGSIGGGGSGAGGGGGGSGGF
ncbi:DUF2207 domain-containing protein [Bacillus shivajii]|uniref:DUF2207 domain-containing protein n=1 Tax=Bacillus shivajii TaxID=1983719 RepID=UPI001CF94F04|nr:DUF2207 domain-containing protein [Bacillus shivajii]UCZ54932.1 DUF2207 domain-containing protein [Bacillus shivajii]